MRRILTAIAMMAAIPAYAQTPLLPKVDTLTLSGTHTTGNLVGATVTPSGGAVALPLSNVLATSFNPANYGAIGDGNSHTVQSVLGITTAAGLTSYSVNGFFPYAWFNTEPFGVRFDLDPAVNVASGSSSINLAGTGTIGVQISSIAAIANTNTTISVADLAVTADQTQVAVGSTVAASCLPAGDTITAVSGSLGAYTLTLATPANGACASGTVLKFGVSSAAGVYVLPVTYTSGIRQGDLITGSSCIAAGTQVDYVNPAKMEVRLSLPTAASCPQNTQLTFIPSWLNNVTVGMKLEGLAGIFANPTNVTAVNTTTGVVSIYPATQAQIVASTAIKGVSSPAYLNSQITFWRPYTDAETAALQIDRLAWQAAINNLSAVTGGQVAANAGKFQIDAPLILPISATFITGTRPNISISGAAGSGISATFLQMTKDTGPRTAMVSCGDPAASAQNQFGLYQGFGYYCQGELHDIVLSGVSYTGGTFGQRPKWNGVPVAMDGLKQGPRLDMERAVVQGFNYGLRITADHTRWEFAQSNSNFIGYYFDDAQAGLYGDEYMSNTYAQGNLFAGIGISARNFLNGQLNKPYIGYNGYAIYLEASPGANGAALISVTMTNANMEANDCGIIKDGGLADGFLPTAGSGLITDVEITSGFFGVGVNSSHVPTDGTAFAGGCAYNAAFDVSTIDGLTMHRTNNLSLIPVAGQTAIIRTNLSDLHFSLNNGGGRIDGDASLWDLLQSFSAQNIPVITGYGSLGQDNLIYNGGLGNWKLTGAGWKGQPIPVQYNTASAYKLGQVMEYGNQVYGPAGSPGVQFAGTTTNSPVAGTIITPSAPASGTPYNNNFIPIICTGGFGCPVLTTATPVQGTMLKVGTVTPGTAVVASGTNDTGNGTSPIGIITRVDGATLAHMKTLFPGAE